MADWGGGVQRAASPALISNNIVSGATANVMGSWVTVGTLTTRADGLILVPNYFGSSAHDRLIDIGIGPAGSELVIYEAVNISAAGVSLEQGMSQEIPVPLSIPSGVRVAARSQASTAGAKDGYITIAPFATGAPTYGRATLLAADKPASRGVPIVSGSTSFVFGAWSQIIAATPHRILALDVHIGSLSSTSNRQVGMQLAVGAAGQEVMVHNYGNFGSNSGFATARYFHTPLDIPVGSRLSIRISAQNNGSTTAYMTFRGFA